MFPCLAKRTDPADRSTRRKSFRSAQKHPNGGNEMRAHDARRRSEKNFRQSKNAPRKGGAFFKIK
jgi:hypothetical protein